MSRFSVILIGEEQSGKTKLIQAVLNKDFNSDYKPTIGADFATLSLKSPKVTLTLWDSAGQKRFKSLAATFSKNKDAYLFVYDLTDNINLKDYLIEHCPEDLNTKAAIFVVGTKKDCLDTDTLQKKESELKAFLSNKEMLSNIHPSLANKEIHYATVSAKTQEGVYELFKTVAEKVDELRPPQEIANNLQKPGTKNQHLDLASKKDLNDLAELISKISANTEFWSSKLGASALGRGKTSPDGVEQIKAESTTTDLIHRRLENIQKNADYKRSSTSAAEWFHSFFRSRHPATEQYYQILSNLDNLSQETVKHTTERLNAFKNTYKLDENGEWMGRETNILEDSMNSSMNKV